MYYIQGSSGCCYDDYRTWVVAVYDTKEDADKNCSILKSLSESIEAKREDLVQKTSNHEPDTKSYKKAWNMYSNFAYKHGDEKNDYQVYEISKNTQFNEWSKLP